MDVIQEEGNQTTSINEDHLYNLKANDFAMEITNSELPQTSSSLVNSSSTEPSSHPLIGGECGAENHIPNTTERRSQ